MVYNGVSNEIYIYMSMSVQSVAKTTCYTHCHNSQIIPAKQAGMSTLERYINIVC